MDAVARSAASTVASFFAARVRETPQRVAVEGAGRHLTYAALNERARRLAAVLDDEGVGRGDRVAVLSENRVEYVEVFLAAAQLGATAACQNWRLSERELGHCLDLVEPAAVVVSERHRDTLAALERDGPAPIVFGDDYEARLENATPRAGESDAEPEDGLLLLYTSGTTGLPKGAVISHRAEIARNFVIRAEFGVAPEDTFVAWSPLYHMGAADPTLGTLMAGGTVIVVDGFDRPRLAEIVATREVGWLLLMPGMIQSFIDELRAADVTPRGVKVCGVMADLVPPSEIAEITRLLDAPYANTFGATETGCPPCSSSLLPVGEEPRSLSKRQSPFCEVRLVDGDDRDVDDGVPGELCMRGPTLFSGYFRADDVNDEDFRGGWFHMGDVFVRNDDGTLAFVDRVKYLIKSGGENIYPAEIERVLLRDARVADAAVVRRPDGKWGEVPVAFVALREGASASAEELIERCGEELARYKRPKGVHFLPQDELPRSVTGKIQRHVLEERLAEMEETAA